MDMKPLGQTGIQLPEIGFGTWKYRGDLSIIRSACNSGSFLVDSAESYGTEHFVGAAIQGNREAYFLATKVSPSHFRYQDILNAAERSLMELGTDVIDLYQLHWPSKDVHIDETMRAMDKLLTDGKVRFVGVSNFSVGLLKEAERALGDGRVVANQIKYSLLDHEFADETLSYCQERSITVLAYSSLEQGEFHNRITTRPELAEVIRLVSGETDKTPAQILLNWVLREPNVVTIPMTNRIERVRENAEASGWRLTDEQHKALTDAAGASHSVRWWST